MTVTSIDSPSRRLTAEIRAEAARQGISLREVSRRLEVSQMWVSRRVKVTADVNLTFEDLERIAGALDTSAEELLRAAGWPVTHRYPNTQTAFDRMAA